MARFFSKPHLLYTPETGPHENYDGISFIPRVYAPINSGTFGIDAVRNDGAIIPGVWTTGEIAYTSGTWDNISNTALKLVDSNRYDIYISGSDIDAGKGSFSCWYRPHYDYNNNNQVTRLIISGTDFVRIYYDYTEETFYGQLKSGTSPGTQWDTIQVSGTHQLFVSGTDIHISLTYDNTRGVDLYLSGTLMDSIIGNWTKETAPANLSIGNVSGSIISSAEGVIDDIRYYKSQVLTSAEVYKLSLINYGLN